MDTINFSVVEADDIEIGSVVAIAVNGRDLLEWVRDVELPFAVQEGHPNIAGGYVGLSPAAIPNIWSHLHGEAAPLYSQGDEVTLYDCECGCPGCWPLQVRIKVGEDTVIWSDFQQPHRGEHSRVLHWRYDELGLFVFDRAQYEEALQTLS